jgi:pimeloyl-ACP methyl ester carboxylesterase
MGSTVETSIEIRPFHVDIPEEDLVDLRRRIAATRWPDKETVADQSQGVQLEKLQALVRYWETDYDWRKAEAKLNAQPQFVTDIDGLDIHVIHVRSRHEDALPLIMSHGWPGSIFELLKVIEPLTDPTAHGGAAEDAFHLVIPSLPGYGFSARPEAIGWDPDRIARAWDELMGRLGYDHYVSQGGDWGAVVAKRWADRRRPDCAASTSTWRRRYQPRWRRHSPASGPCRLTCPSRNGPCSTRSAPTARAGTRPTS